MNSTEELQAWNKPKNKKTEPMLILEMTFSRKKPDIGAKKRKRLRQTAYLDPRATGHRGESSRALDSLMAGKPKQCCLTNSQCHVLCPGLLVILS